jgi:hypothetical protein
VCAFFCHPRPHRPPSLTLVSLHVSSYNFPQNKPCCAGLWP